MACLVVWRHLFWDTFEKHGAHLDADIIKQIVESSEEWKTFDARSRGVDLELRLATDISWLENNT